MVRLLILLGTTVLLIVDLAGTKAAGQTAAPIQRVLVLYSDERLLPANIIVDEAIRATFAVGTDNRIEFHSEFLDVARFPGEEEQQRQRDFFRDKYRERPPDLVIAVRIGPAPAGDLHHGAGRGPRAATSVPDSQQRLPAQTSCRRRAARGHPFAAQPVGTPVRRAPEHEA